MSEIDDLRAAKDGAYHERDQVVAALATLALRNGWRVGTARTEIPGWDPEWFGCVYIDLPTGQASWHFHDSEAGLFAHLPSYPGEWDGHSTPQKYERLAALAKIPDRQFPVLAWEKYPGAPKSIPWSRIEPFDGQARRNHSQTLKRLAERGGLSPDEAVAVMEGRDWHSMEKRTAVARLRELAGLAPVPA